LGAGTGASLIGALLSMRHGVKASFNPFYTLTAPHYSDIFLTITCIVLVALIVTLNISSRDLKQ
ncbi:UNVERIFIED_CONTAM: hypothetical protein P3E19_20685, partial [Pseudomonas aeruginosa]